MELRDFIKDVPWFPKPEVTFKDIWPLLWNREAFKYTIDALAKSVEWKADVIVGLDARGFIFGAAVAYALGLPFVMIRKKGKLPGETIDFEYTLEYGSNTLSIQRNTIQTGERVAIVDDVLATGGTMQAATQLIEWVWAEVTQISFLMSLTFLPWEDLLKKYSVTSLIRY